LGLLRLAAFPLVVIGIAVDPGGTIEPVKGYTVDEEDAEDTGDIGQASAPVAPAFLEEPVKPPSTLSDSFYRAIDGLFPPTSPFPLVRRLVIVPPHLPRNPTPRPSLVKNGSNGRIPGSEEEGRRGGKGEQREGEVVYAPSEGIEGWVNRMMGEVVGEVLSELGELVSGMLYLTIVHAHDVSSPRRQLSRLQPE